MQIGSQEFAIGHRTYVMGILNVTPDSFSDGGNYLSVSAAVSHAKTLVAEGADIIDIGGESTRPGHSQISDNDEIARIAPVIRAVKKECSVPVSIDTYKPAVFQAALDAGADMLNDIWGLLYAPDMAVLAAKAGVPCCLMHNRQNNQYQSLIKDIIADLQSMVQNALSHGVKKDRLILDPGIGFAKDYQQNLQVMAHLSEIKKALPYPMLLGTSRKSMIGKALQDAPPESRLSGTIATTAIGIQAGCDFIRVHDVKENKEACLMADAIFRG